MPFQTTLEAVNIAGGADLPFVIRVPKVEALFIG